MQLAVGELAFAGIGAANVNAATAAPMIERRMNMCSSFPQCSAA
jgi:hypothetical protein